MDKHDAEGPETRLSEWTPKKLIYTIKTLNKGSQIILKMSNHPLCYIINLSFLAQWIKILKMYFMYLFFRYEKG